MGLISKLLYFLPLKYHLEKSWHLSPKEDIFYGEWGDGMGVERN